MLFGSTNADDCRLSTDVQDFKSSFKLCVSQGLRSATQVPVISLFLHPSFTAVILMK